MGQKEGTSGEITSFHRSECFFFAIPSTKRKLEECQIMIFYFQLEPKNDRI